MDEKQIESWRTVSAKGQLQYALVYGGLVWGIPTGLLLVVTDFIFRLVKAHFALSFFVSDVLGRYVFEIVGFYLAGCVLGLVMWSRYEREYSESVGHGL